MFKRELVYDELHASPYTLLRRSPVKELTGVSRDRELSTAICIYMGQSNSSPGFAATQFDRHTSPQVHSAQSPT